MKKAFLLIACVLMLFSYTADAQPGFCKEYGNSLAVDTVQQLPEIPIVERRYTLKPCMASDDAITSLYDIELSSAYKDADTGVLRRIYENDELYILCTSNGNYCFKNGDNKSIECLFMYCIDAFNGFRPDGDWMNDVSEFDYMSGNDACAIVENNMQALFPEVCDSLDITFRAHPAHAEDMRAKVTEILANECAAQADVELYERKHGLYEGCITENDDYYFIEGMFRFDDMPLLRGVMDLSDELYVEGPLVWAIVGRDGLLYMECGNLLAICNEQHCDPVQHTTDELLARAGMFLDSIAGMEPLRIDRVELICVPYPTSQYEYETVPTLVLSKYDAVSDDYRHVLSINTLTLELIF